MFLYLQASFSIRDDGETKLITKISKPRTTIEIFHPLYNKEVSPNNMWYIEDKEKSYIQFCAYIGLSNIRSNPTQFIFLNNIPVRCPLILREISDTFIDVLSSVRRVQRKNAFILLFITCPEYIFTIEQEKRTLLLPRVHDLLQSITVKMINIFRNNVTPLFGSVSRRIRSNKNLIYINANSLNNMNLFKNTSILRQPLVSEESVIEAGQPFTPAPRNSIVIEQN